jgi:hypothetical protein
MSSKVRRSLVALAVAGALLSIDAPLRAEDAKLTVEGSAPLRETLKSHVGAKVLLRTVAGEEIGGTVRQVGDSAVHLSELSGREFYDAVIRLDHVSAVIVRAREK